MLTWAHGEWQVDNISFDENTRLVYKLFYPLQLVSIFHTVLSLIEKFPPSWIFVMFQFYGLFNLCVWVLTRTFSRFPSFQKARVIRDKRSNKSKGWECQWNGMSLKNLFSRYGFVSFKDPQDFTRAIKELNGKYVGSRPIKLSKSSWKDRNIDQVKQKQNVKKQMGYKY